MISDKLSLEDSCSTSPLKVESKQPISLNEFATSGQDNFPSGNAFTVKLSEVKTEEGKDDYGRFEPVIKRIIAEAKLNFEKWERTLKDWTVWSKTKEHTLYTTNDPSNEDLLTLKLMAVAENKQGDVIGAFQHMLTSGDMEKHDSYITNSPMFTSQDGSIMIEHKHLKNPWPLVWARSLISVRYDWKTDVSYSRNFISCDDILKYKIPDKSIMGYNRGKHQLIKKGSDWHYTFIMQVNPRGRLGMIPMLLKFMAGYAGEEVSKAYQMVITSDLEEPGLVTFKSNLKKYGLVVPGTKK